jgi:hypothetical protein
MISIVQKFKILKDFNKIELSVGLKSSLEALEGNLHPDEICWLTGFSTMNLHD